MADEKVKPEAPGQKMLLRGAGGPGLTKELLRTERLPAREKLFERILPGVISRPTIPPAPPTVKPPEPAQPAAPPSPSLPPAVVPAAPGSNPLKDLPFPAPGDRIKADDFKKLSQSLRIIYEAYLLSGSLFGRSFAEAKLALASQQYQVSRVMSVFGSEIESPNDASLDARKVIQVVPLELGERSVAVILTEAVETRRFTPNLMGLTYREASERLQAMLGDLTFPSTTMTASQLVGLSLAEAKQTTQR